MTRGQRLAGIAATAVAGLLIAASPVSGQSPAGASGSPPPPPPMSTNATVFATGLDNPRGLVFGPDGALYVAEGGTGGTTSTAGKCDQVVAPVGPYASGSTARISKIDSTGHRTTVIDGLPSSQTAATQGSLVSGVAAVAFVGDTLYYVLAGAGCSHGVADVPNGVFTVGKDGKATLVADISSFVKTNPTAKPNPGDFEPDETTYSLVAYNSALYIVNPNHGSIERMDIPLDSLTRVIDVSASQGHVVPTAMAVGPDGDFYVGNLSTFPVVAGAADIYKVTSDGQISVDKTGVTAVTGVAFVGDQLYVLEMSGPPTDPNAPIAPFSGRVVHVTDSGVEPVATGLMFPTAMTVGPDGNLYVSNFGLGGPPGAGQVVKVDLSMALPSSAP